jgi:hypothetical protein
MDGSKKEPLINLKVVPKEKEIIFLVYSGADRSSLIWPPDLSLFSGSSQLQE